MVRSTSREEELLAMAEALEQLAGELREMVLDERIPVSQEKRSPLREKSKVSAGQKVRVTIKDKYRGRYGTIVSRNARKDFWNIRLEPLDGGVAQMIYKKSTSFVQWIVSPIVLRCDRCRHVGALCAHNRLNSVFANVLRGFSQVESHGFGFPTQTLGNVVNGHAGVVESDRRGDSIGMGRKAVNVDPEEVVFVRVGGSDNHFHHFRNLIVSQPPVTASVRLTVSTDGVLCGDAQLVGPMEKTDGGGNGAEPRLTASIFPNSMIAATFVVPKSYLELLST